MNLLSVFLVYVLSGPHLDFEKTNSEGRWQMKSETWNDFWLPKFFDFWSCQRGVMTLSILAFSLMTFSIMSFSFSIDIQYNVIVIQHNDIQHNDIQHNDIQYYVILIQHNDQSSIMSLTNLWTKVSSVKCYVCKWYLLSNTFEKSF